MMIQTTGPRRLPGAILLAAAGLLVAAACADDGTGDGPSRPAVAVLFVGHGEPARCQDGDTEVHFADGSAFGPHGVGLGVPSAHQFTEWAAAYEEIATAMTYVFSDLNGNDVPHEVAISPAGDVPPFFTWDAFHESVYEYYAAFDNYSPHNDRLAEHVASLDVQLEGVDVDVYLAYLDAVPRIPNAVWDAMHTRAYDTLVVVPMLLASSTHTQEVEAMVIETAHLTSAVDVLVTEPFFETPHMRARIHAAVMAMAEDTRQRLPAGVADDDIGVLLASHGTPYVPPFPEFGWEPGEIHSNLLITEARFHEELAQALPWATRTGRMNYAEPSLEASLAAFEADGIAHVMVIPSAFPTAAMHTMWDVANDVVGRAVLPKEGVIAHRRDSGMMVYYSARGYADLETGRAEFRAGLALTARLGVLESLARLGGRP